MAINIPTLQQLLEAGVHFGHQVRRGNPKMKPFIYGAREGVHIIDLTKSEEYLKKAGEYAYELGKQGKVLLFIGTKKQARPILEEYCTKIDAPYLSQRWIGGFLTNFEEISKNIKKMKELKEQKEKGELSKYTKKEQLLIDRKISKLDRDLKGVINLAAVPDAVFIIDTVSENTATKEANLKGLKLIAIADSNSDPSVIDYPIPGNDDAIKSIRVLTEAVANAYAEGKKQSVKATEEQKPNPTVDKKDESSKPSTKAEDKPEVKVAGTPAVAEQVAVAEELVEKDILKKDSARKVE